MPEISIITPVYQAEKFLKKCVDSILSQSFTDWELLLVDDGSTDKSSEICRTYAEQDARIRYHQKENGGVSSARNAGDALAEGVISRLWTATISQRRIFWKHCIVWRKNMMPK